MDSPKIKMAKNVLLLVLAAVVIYIVYVACDIYLYGRINEMETADVAVILGAGVWGSQVSPVFKERINHGIWLYENGYVGKLILTGGKRKETDISDAFIARKYAIEKGVPEKDILFEEMSSITQENIYYAALIMKKNNLSTAIFVSDPLHMKRAMRIARDYNIVAYSSPTPSTRYRTFKTKVPFLMREMFFTIGYQLFGRLYTPAPAV